MKAILLFIIPVILACSTQSQSKLLSLKAFSTNSSCLEDCCNSLSERPPMTYYYYQNTGRFKGGSGDFSINVLGYSGQGAGYNNPDYQCKPAGPLPASTYEVAFCKNIMHQITQRPCSFYLKPLYPQQVCGRDDFFIHGCQSCTSGDDSDPPSPGCSEGCVIISYKERRKIRVGDRIIVNNYQPKAEANENSQ